MGELPCPDLRANRTQGVARRARWSCLKSLGKSLVVPLRMDRLMPCQGLGDSRWIHGGSWKRNAVGFRVKVHSVALQDAACPVSDLAAALGRDDVMRVVPIGNANAVSLKIGSQSL